MHGAIRQPWTIRQIKEDVNTVNDQENAPRQRRKSFRTINCWRMLSQEQWKAFPEGTVRSVRLSEDFSLSVEKNGPDSWLVHTRGKVPTSKLAGLLTAPRVRRGRFVPLDEWGME
jgi:hypothetical protein